MIKNVLLILLNTLGWLAVGWQIYVGIVAVDTTQQLSCYYLSNPYYLEYHKDFLELCRLDYYFYPILKILEAAGTMIEYYLLRDLLSQYKGILAGLLAFLNIQLVERLLSYTLYINDQCDLYSYLILIAISVLITGLLSTSIWYVKRCYKA